jgi:cutinase
LAIASTVGRELIFKKGKLGSGFVKALKSALPDVAIEGVNYSAGLLGNITPQGADAEGIKMAQDLFKQAAAKCSKSALLGGGYSQGAALMHRAIEALDKSVQDKIAGVTLFGDTKNKQDGGRIKNFPPEKVKIFCNQDDGVCGGGLNVCISSTETQDRHTDNSIG